MKDVKLEFDGYWIDVENGWLCMGDEENQVLLRPGYFKKLLAAINYTHCCKSDSELLPKRLSASAYTQAMSGNYEEFVKWWDSKS